MPVSVQATITQPLSMLQYVQTIPQSEPTRVFVENMVGESDLLGALKVLPADRGKRAYLDISRLPSVGFRPFNSNGNQDNGEFSPREEDTFPIDQFIYVDRAIIDRLGVEGKYRQEYLTSIALSQYVSAQIIKGDNALIPYAPSGMQTRCNKVGTNLFYNSAASGGAALSLFNIDALIWAVRKPTHLIVPRSLMPYFDAAARNSSITGSVFTTGQDDFGRRVTKYKGLTILYGYDPDDTPDLLPMTEVASGGGAAVTGSIYAVNLDSDGFYLIEQTPMTVTDQGRVPGTVYDSTHIKWDLGFAREHPRSIARLSSIALGALVA